MEAKQIADKIRNLDPTWQQAFKHVLQGDSTGLIPRGIGVKNCHEASCVYLDSQIDTQLGLLEIGNVATQASGHRDWGVTVATDTGPQLATESYRQEGRVPTRFISTRRGFHLGGTPQHKVRNEHDNWVSLGEVRKGQCLRIQLGSVWPEEDVEIPYNPRNLERAGFQLQAPLRLTEDWACFLGWWIADGSFWTQTTTFSVNENKRDYLTPLLTRLGLPWVITEDIRPGKSDCWSVQIHSVFLVEWMQNALGLVGHAEEKTIPWPVLRGSLAITRAFVSGIMSGDGCVKTYGVITYSTSSQRLAEQLLQTWRRLGIVAAKHVYEDKRDPRVLSVKGREAITRGEARDEDHKLKDMWQVQTQKRWLPLIHQWIHLPSKRQVRVDRNVAEMDFPATIKDVTGVGSKTKMVWWDGDKASRGEVCGILLDPVRVIREEEGEVADLVVPQNNTYIANGFISHNTQGRWRERSLETIQEAAETGIRLQGGERVSFYSLTWSLHSQVYSLLLWNYSRFGNTNLISQRADQASADPNFFKFQNYHGEKAATIGVEGISQAMRNFYNKSLGHDQLIQACENAAHAGYTSLKWFMITSGLETPNDFNEFDATLRELKQRFKKIARDLTKQTGVPRSPIRIMPSFMLLITLPHTALQWSPCASSFNLEADDLKQIVDVTKELGFGFRTSMTKEKIRVNQWTSIAGRESTRIMVEVGLRTGYLYYGPTAKKVSWMLDQVIEKEENFDWMYWFREKDWDHVFPWDGVLTPMRRDYLWNQWRVVREKMGAAYCLKTSINPNPKCHDCGGCGTAVDRKFMLSRPLESSDSLIGQESARRDMTVQQRIRWKIDITDETLRIIKKEILARNVTRAMMIAAWEKHGFYDETIMSHLEMEGHSLKHAEGQGNLPWVHGCLLIDSTFNAKWDSSKVRELIPRMNQILWGMKVVDLVVGLNLPPMDKNAYALYVVDMPMSAQDLRVQLETLNEAREITFRQRKTVGRDTYRIEKIVRTRSDVVPMAFAQPTKDGKTRLSVLCNVRNNPLHVLSQVTGKRMNLIKSQPIFCLGYYQYDRAAVTDPDDFMDGSMDAIFAGRGIYCGETGEPIETDLFNGELYESHTGPDLCLAADLKGLLKMREDGVDILAHSIKR